MTVLLFPLPPLSLRTSKVKPVICCSRLMAKVEGGNFMWIKHERELTFLSYTHETSFQKDILRFFSFKWANAMARPSFYKREKNDLFSIEPLTSSKGRPLQIGEMSSRLRLWVCLPPFHVRGIFPIKRGQEKAVRFPLYVSHISSSPASYYLGIRTINISCPVKGQNLFNKASGSCCFDRGYK